MKKLLGFIVCLLLAFPAVGQITGNSLAIGASVSGATANSILYVGASGLAQDNTNFTWNRDSVAGKGLYFNAGTAASAVSALQIKQEWSYNVAAIDGIDVVFTDTSSHANTNALRIRGGAAGATELLKLSKGGRLTLTSDGFVGGANTSIDVSVTGLYLNQSSGLVSWRAATAFSELSAGTVAVGTGAAGSVAGGLALKAVNSYSQTTDAAPPVPLYRASNAYAQAATNTAGADLVIGPGIGRRFATVVDYSLLDAGVDTITITVNGAATVGTADAATQDGTHWVIGATNDATATNIATWMSTISGVTGAAVGASAYATPASTTHTLTIATNADAGEMTVTSGADGLPYLGAVANGAAAGAGTISNAPQAGNPSVYIKMKAIIAGTLTTVAVPAWTVP